MFKGFIFDLDGTVYLGDHLIAGAERVVRVLRKMGRKVVFLSNKPLQGRDEYAAKLTRLGIPTAPDDVINSTFVLLRYLRKTAPGARVFPIAEPPMIAELAANGFTITDDPGRIDYVIASFDRTFDYGKLLIAFRAIRSGAHFVATNPDRTCPFAEGELPDCAAVIAAIEAVTERPVEVIAGKPSPLAAEMILDAIGLRAHECLLVGDRLETDIRMALEAGMKAALVMTGGTTAEALGKSSWHPHYVLESIADVEDLAG